MDYVAFIFAVISVIQNFFLWKQQKTISELHDAINVAIYALKKGGKYDK